MRPVSSAAITSLIETDTCRDSDLRMFYEVGNVRDEVEFPERPVAFLNVRKFKEWLLVSICFLPLQMICCLSICFDKERHTGRALTKRRLFLCLEPARREYCYFRNRVSIYSSLVTIRVKLIFWERMLSWEHSKLFITRRKVGRTKSNDDFTKRCSHLCHRINQIRTNRFLTTEKKRLKNS